MKNRLLKIVLCLLLLAVMPVTAQQKFHIVSFDESPLDMTARDAQHEKIDGNGDRFAIVKVTSTSADDDLRAYNFDFGYMESLVESKGNELWVYVQRNAKHVTITRSGYHAVSKYDLRTTIQPGCVYVMQLSPEAKAASMQFLMFEVSPADSKAIIMFTDISSGGEEKLFGAIDIEGCAAKKLRLGEYSYRVVSENYHESEGRIVLSTNNGKHVEQVTLRPNFARITLNVSLDADIYVNDEKKGTGTWNGILSPGTYSIECRKEKYKSSFETITVEEGKDVTYTLKAPEPITGVLSLLSTPLEAAITIDGKPAGETPSIVENLLIGEHKVTLSKNGYKSATIDVIIKENETTEHNVTLQPGEEKQPATPSQGGNVVSKPRDPNELLCIACANKNDGSIAYFTGRQWKALAANEKSRYAQLGVSIKENGHEFIIAAKDCQDPEDGDYKLKFGGYDIDFAGVRNYENGYKVREAYITTGYSDTKAIIEQTKGKTDSKGIKGAPAAEAAWNYKANSHDSLQWYLPSYSELYMIYMNRGKINSFLNKYFTDYNSIPKEWYWSSTESGRSMSWTIDMFSGFSDYNYYRGNSYRVRAVASVKENETTEHNVTLQPGEEKQPATPSQGGNVVSKPRDPNELLCIACANKNDGSIAYFTGRQWKALAANEKSRYAQLGVSIKENGHEFIIAAKDCQDPEDGDYKLKFGGYDIDFAGVRNYENGYKVREAYITTGYSDTKAIIEQTKGKTDSKGIKGAPAAEAAWNYKANSHDSLQWYLPSQSELYMIYRNIYEINSFLNEYFTDYNSIPEVFHWSSTEFSRSVSWFVCMYSGSSDGTGRTYSIRVRAVASVK